MVWPSAEVRHDLMYWKNPRDTGILFGSVLVVLLAVKYVSVISVVANLSLALITATMAFRIYKSVLAAVNKSSDGHPFKQYLECDVTLPVDQIVNLTDQLVKKANELAGNLKKILLVEDFFETIKFTLAMYMLTYIGGWINGLTIIIIVWVAIFTLPKIYQDNQAKIDEAILPLKAKWDDMMSKLSTPAVVAKKVD